MTGYREPTYELDSDGRPTSAKFRAFRDALAALCLQHGVYLAPTRDEDVGVWDLPPGDDPMAYGGFDDLTERG